MSDKPLTIEQTQFRLLKLQQLLALCQLIQAERSGQFLYGNSGIPIISHQLYSEADKLRLELWPL